MHWETLYLQHPKKQNYLQFTFGVDFFAAQGDRRWWHDHRVPGGIAFTANSVGHMRAYREWYEGKKRQSDWVLQTAMLTIDAAAETSYGKATWLKDLDSGGRPVLTHLRCPFAKSNEIKPQLKGRDWTRYGGYLHTDHSIRPEFFKDNPEPLPDLTAFRFVSGQAVSEEEVIKVLGATETWSRIAAPLKHIRKGTEKERHKLISTPKFSSPSSPKEKELANLLGACEAWALTPEQLRELE